MTAGRRRRSFFYFEPETGEAACTAQFKPFGILAPGCFQTLHKTSFGLGMLVVIGPKEFTRESMDFCAIILFAS